MQAIINTKLILEDSYVWDGAVTFENGRIVQCGKRAEVDIPADAELIDAQGLYTAAGLSISITTARSGNTFMPRRAHARTFSSRTARRRSCRPFTAI